MIRAVGLRFSYGGAPLLNGVNLEVRRGESAAILGRSGSGKTTLLKLLAGLLKPASGLLENSARATAYIPQSLGLVETATALENVLFATLSLKGMLAGAWGKEAKARALEALDAVGLRDKAHVKVGRLSGGERQRVAVARALMQGADLLLADEPVASLDLDTAREVLALMAKAADGGALVAVMHDLDLAREFFQSGYRLEAGVLKRIW